MCFRLDVRYANIHFTKSRIIYYILHSVFCPLAKLHVHHKIGYFVFLGLNFDMLNIPMLSLFVVLYIYIHLFSILRMGIYIQVRYSFKENKYQINCAVWTNVLRQLHEMLRCKILEWPVPNIFFIISVQSG